MAKPGSAAARRIAGAVDLTVAGMSEQEARVAQEAIEHELGGRCNGCGRRITIGHRFTSIDVRDPQRPVVRMFACARDDCDFAERCLSGATMMEPIEFAWVDENGKDAPASLMVQRRQRPRSEPAES